MQVESKRNRTITSFVIFALLLVFGLTPLTAQTLARIGDEEITADDFRQRYTHTYLALPKKITEARRFLNRLIDFKVKVREAQARGIPSEAAVQKEIADYREGLAISYLLKHRLSVPGAKILYERRKEELELWQIFLKFQRNEDGVIDSTTVYNNALAVLKEVRESGLPFDSLAMKYSDDKKKAESRGKLGWWIAGIGYPYIDDAIYQMQKGDISPRPVRSPFGYHIFKVTERRQALQRMRGSHILYRLDIQNPLDTIAAFARLSLVLDTLNKGLATFEELAIRNSNDPISGAEGGDLGWMDRGSLEEHFELALLTLKVGEVSKVVRTKFGMHIIKKTADGDMPAYEDVEQRLLKIYESERFNDEFERFVQMQLEKEEFTRSPDVEKILLSRLSSDITTSTPNWWENLNDKDRSAYLFRIGGQPYTVEQAIERINKDPELQMRRFTAKGLDSIIVNLALRQALVLATANLEQEYPEFGKLIEEYKSGVYVSALESRDIHNIVIVSDEDASTYWERHKDEFKFPNRVNFDEILMYGDEFASKILDSINAGVPFDDMQAKHSRRTGIRSKAGKWGLVPANMNEVSRAAWKLKEGSISKIVKTKKGYSILRANNKEKARRKTFEEASPEVNARAKQENIEAYTNDWITGLREKHEVEVFDTRLEAVLDPEASQ